ncbi:STN domain-containing protein [Kiritimatiellaeota bacterium B1221]|nr:STN domain-containing protein [Kiritimatiellaeota bacterium B1221]
MHKMMIGLLLLGAWGLVAQAEEFYLKENLSDRIYGPFSTETGSEVKVNGKSFTVVELKTEASPEEKAFLAELNEIVIKEVNFRNAPLRNTVDSIVDTTRELDPKGVGVNIIIAKVPESETPAKKEKAPDAFGGFGGGFVKPGQGITLKLRDVTVLQLLNALMDTTGYTYKTAGNIITIIPN